MEDNACELFLFFHFEPDSDPKLLGDVTQSAARSQNICLNNPKVYSVSIIILLLSAEAEPLQPGNFK